MEDTPSSNHGDVEKDPESLIPSDYEARCEEMRKGFDPETGLAKLTDMHFAKRFVNEILNRANNGFYNHQSIIVMSSNAEAVVRKAVVEAFPGIVMDFITLKEVDSRENAYVVTFYW